MGTLTLLFGALLPTAHGSQAHGTMVSIVAHSLWEQRNGWTNQPSSTDFSQGENYVNFVSAHVEKKWKTISQKHPGLSHEQAMAIKMYTDQKMQIFSTVNKVQGWGKHQKHKAAVKKAVSYFSVILLSGIVNAGLTSHGTVYRGLKAQPYSHNVGDIITDTGYMSTSLNQGVTEKPFYKGGKCTSLTILGGVGLKIPNVLGNKTESEVLIPPTSRFEIISSEIDGQVHRLTLRFLGSNRRLCSLQSLSVRIRDMQVSEPKSRSASSSPVHSGNSSWSRSEIEAM